jgi:hypothetical protein
VRPVLNRLAWNKAAFIVFWEGQSQVASVAYIALVAFFSIWLALVTMLIWSLLATVFFFAARERGYPNMLSAQTLPRRRIGLGLIGYAVGSLGRAWLTGVHAFLFARCSSFLVAQREGCCRLRRVARFFVIVFSLTMFGVSMAEHILRSAGYKGARLFRLGLIGPFLNVPYRVLFSAAVIAFVQGTASRL